MTGDGSVRRDGLTLFLFWLFMLPAYAIWLWQDRITGPWDMSVHSMLAYQLWTDFHFERLYHPAAAYPPLFHLLAAPLTLIGSHPDVYSAANWPVLLVAMEGTRRLGVALAGKIAGIAAGLLLPAYIYISWMCRMAMIDLVLTATVVWTLWLVARGRRLNDGRQAHALGWAMGLGLLSKYTYGFYVAVPLLLYLFNQWRAIPRSARFRGFWRPLRGIILWPILIAGPWYWAQVPELLASARHKFVDVAQAEGDPSGLTFDSLMFYPRILYKEYFTLPLLIPAIVGLVWLTTRFKKNPVAKNALGWLLITSSLISGYVIITIIGNKSSRYTMPLVPLIAVISTVWLECIQASRRSAIVALVGCFALGTVYWNMFVFYRPTRWDPCIEPAAEWMVDHKPKKRLNVAVLPNHWFINGAAMNYALYRRDERAGAARIKKPLTPELSREFDYIVTEDPPTPKSNLDLFGEANSQWISSHPEWKSVKTLEQRAGRRLVIYGRNTPSIK